MTASSDDEIDLREVFAALRRRWRWIVGSCFLGLALAGGSGLTSSRSAPKRRPACFWMWPRFHRVLSSSVKSMQLLSSRVSPRVCPAEVDRLRLRLNQLAKNFDQVDYKVDRLAFDVKGRDLGAAQLVLALTSTADRVSEVSSALAQIQQRNECVCRWLCPSHSDVDSDWILVEEPSKLVFRETSFLDHCPWLIGWSGLGAGSALIADRRSNLVYSREELLRRLQLSPAPWFTGCSVVCFGR